MIFAGYALVVAVLFMFIFKDDSKKVTPQMEEAVIDGNGSAADGMVND